MKNILSASQIETYLQCPRKWFHKYVELRPTKSNKSAALGGSVHKQLENHLKGQRIDFTSNAGYIAQALTELAPCPTTPGLEPERGFEFEHLGQRYRGFKDYEYQMPTGEHVVGDFKTTSNLLYAKTEEDLAHDIQAMLYAKETFQRTGTDLPVTLEWLYVHTDTRGTELNTRQRKTKRVHLKVIPEHVENVMSEISELAKEIQNLYSEPNRNNAKKEIGHCRAYGGCPFFDICELTFEERLEATMTESKKGSSLLDRMKARKEAMGGTTSPAAINPPEYTPDETPAYVPEAVKIPVDLPEVTVKIAEPTPEQKALQEKIMDKIGTRIAEREAIMAPFLDKVQMFEDMQNMSVKPMIDTLYLFCTVEGVSTMSLDILIQNAHDRVLSETGAKDYRLLDYGKGAGLLLVAFKELLADALQEHPSNLCYQVSHDSPELRIVLSYVQSMSDIVVTGVK